METINENLDSAQRTVQEDEDLERKNKEKVETEENKEKD